MITWYDPEGGSAGGMVNGLTTLAARLARAYVADLDKPQEALSLANQRLTEHLLPGGFDLAQAPVADLSLAPEPWPRPRTALGLFHAGLSHYAHSLGERGPVPVSTLNVITTLALDLADGVFDGAQKPGVPLEILAHHPVDVEITRWTLAFHTDAFLQAGDYDSTDLVYDTLASNGGFLAVVSTDGGPLYPPSVPPKRFDRAPPAIQWLDPTPAAGAAVPGAFDVRLGATDDSPLKSLEVSVPAAQGAITSDPGKGGTVTVHANLIPEGPLTVVARAEDVSENVATDERVLIVDRTPPALAVNAPGAASEPFAEITGTAIDGLSGVERVLVQAGGESWDAAVGPAGTFEAEVTLSPGAEPLAVTATDRAGNEAVWEQMVILDAAPPEIGLQSPNAEDWVGPGPLEVSAVVGSLAPVTAVTVEAGGEVEDAEPAGGDVWTATITPPPEDGAFTVWIRATDAALNQADKPLPLKRDGAPPVLSPLKIAGSVAGPDGGTFVKAGLNVAQVTASDAGSGMATVIIGGAPATHSGAMWQAYLALPPGPSALEVEATDAVGNTATTSRSVIGDDAPPTCTLDPVGNDGYINDLTPSLIGTWDDADGVNQVTVTIYGSAGPLKEAAVFEEGVWRTTLPPLEEGPVALTVVCADTFGHETTLTTNLIVDVTPPPIILAPHSFPNEGPKATISPAEDCQPSGENTWSCSEITRFLPSLKPTASNLPGFKFLPSGAQGLMWYRLENEDWVSGNEIVLSTATIDWSKPPPTFLEVKAHDVAGNVRVHRYEFTLKLLIPPPIWTPYDWSWTMSWDARNFELGDGDAHVLASNNPPAAVKAHSGFRIARYFVQNPHDFPMVVDFKGFPALYVSWEENHVYLHEAGSAESCGQFDCPWQHCESGGACETPPLAKSYSSDTPYPLVLDAIPILQRDWFGGIESVYDPVSKEVQIPAHNGVVVEIATTLQGSGLIPPPVTYDGVTLNPTGGFTETVRCWTRECVTESYERVPAITSLTVATKPGAGVTVEYFLPGHYDSGYQKKEPLPVSHTFTVDDLPTSPE